MAVEGSVWKIPHRSPQKRGRSDCNYGSRSGTEVLVRLRREQNVGEVSLIGLPRCSLSIWF